MPAFKRLGMGLPSAWIHLPILITALAVGCAHPQVFLEGKVQPKADSSYLSGIFYKAGDEYLGNFGLGFINLGTHQEVLFAMFKDQWHLLEFRPTDKKDREPAMRIIEVPPGTYQLKFWATWDGDRQNYKVHQFDASKGPMTFTTKPGRVAYVGRFQARYDVTSRSYNYIQWRTALVPETTTTTTLEVHVAMDYPGFSPSLFDPIRFGQ